MKIYEVIEGRNVELKKTKRVKCSICGADVLKCEHGIAECESCGWRFQDGEAEFEEKMGISYPMLVSPTTARKQFSQGLSFKATFEEFVKGLYFYAEMLLVHNQITYEVFFGKKEQIIFCSKDMQQEFETKDDFVEHANINGRLLKDIWDEVTFAGFM